MSTRTRKHKSAWLARVELIGEVLPKSMLHPAVLRRLSGRQLRGPWCVAFSGGMLKAIKAQQRALVGGTG